MYGFQFPMQGFIFSDTNDAIVGDISNHYGSLFTK